MSYKNNFSLKGKTKNEDVVNQFFTTKSPAFQAAGSC